MVRAIALSLCLICAIAALPMLSNSLASSKAKHHRKYRRHSKRWWRRHRAALRRKREMMVRRQRQSTQPIQPIQTAKAQSPSPVPMPNIMVHFPVPGSWKRTGGAAGEVRFDVQGENGRTTGTAVLTRLQLASNTNAPHAKTLNGVPLNELRHMVVDRMFAAGGWIINDAVREVGGQRIFVVQAASNAGGVAARFGANGDATTRVAWNYYFTEINGQMYSLATATTPENAAPLAAETERVLASLPRKENSTTLTAQATR